VNKIRELLN